MQFHTGDFKPEIFTNNFQSFISKESLFKKNDRVLLAVSGGMDSVVMCRIFHEAGLLFGIAHCNYGLRGSESDGDEQFVRELAKEFRVKYFVRFFDPTDFDALKGHSIQSAAREMRYRWFEEVREKEKFNYIATAHHKSDTSETVLMNLVKGTGIAGLHGILTKKGLVIRPLLFASREEIEQYARFSNLRWREDSSNKSDHYLRNKLRLQVIPLLKQINPSLEKTLGENIERIRDVEEVYDRFMEQKKKELLVKKKNSVLISIAKLKTSSPLRSVLFELIRPFGFNGTQVKEIIKALDETSGKKFIAPAFILVKDRTHLILNPTGSEKSKIENEKIKKGDRIFTYGFLTLRIEEMPKDTELKLLVPGNTALLDEKKLTYPLTVRRWKAGDSFTPLGMKSKKKLSDLLIDRKIPITEKEKVFVLLSGKEIVWVIGYRISDKYKVTPKTKSVLRITARSR